MSKAAKFKEADKGKRKAGNDAVKNGAESTPKLDKTEKPAEGKKPEAEKKPEEKKMADEGNAQKKAEEKSAPAEALAKESEKVVEKVDGAATEVEKTIAATPATKNVEKMAAAEVEKVENILQSVADDNKTFEKEEKKGGGESGKNGAEAEAKGAEVVEDGRKREMVEGDDKGPGKMAEDANNPRASSSARSVEKVHEAGSNLSLKSSVGKSSNSLGSIRSTDTGVSVDTVKGVSSAREKIGTHMVKRSDEIETLSGNVMHLESNGETA